MTEKFGNGLCHNTISQLHAHLIPFRKQCPFKNSRHIYHNISIYRDLVLNFIEAGSLISVLISLIVIYGMYDCDIFSVL